MYKTNFNRNGYKSTICLRNEVDGNKSYCYISDAIAKLKVDLQLTNLMDL